MFRTASLILATVAALSLVMACGDDDVKKDPKLDKGSGVTLDQGGGGQDTGGVTLDGGGGGSDTGTPSGKSCAQVYNCVVACKTDTACGTKCIATGTSSAQTDFNALVKCMNGAATGSCKAKCPTPNASGCSACIQTACDKELKKCQGGGGPATAGFGNSCSKSAPCKTGLTCAVTQSGATKGFCTKACTSKGGPCSGSPTGTESYCILSDGKGKYYCSFLCKYKASGTPKTVNCPTGLTCGTKESPAGSGQYACVPK